MIPYLLEFQYYNSIFNGAYFSRVANVRISLVYQLTSIILGNLITYSLKVSCPIITSRKECNVSFVLVYPVNKCVCA